MNVTDATPETPTNTFGVNGIITELIRYKNNRDRAGTPISWDSLRPLLDPPVANVLFPGTTDRDIDDASAFLTSMVLADLVEKTSESSPVTDKTLYEVIAAQVRKDFATELLTRAKPVITEAGIWTTAVNALTIAELGDL
ncbi:hypothetical protein [Aeromicrobium sp. 179-A 4D2 NHS]|uniref:hypothetical protein n=1 Tax=Aeromicrobium sp. 179-A 4D2 NHS TaxID=3142375 RepID=UPI0039A30DFB